MNLLTNVGKTVAKKRKILGRGLGNGKGVKSGRGTTRHQKARTTIPLSFEGGQGKFTKRYPLLRGKSKNKSVFKKPHTVALSKLNIFEDGTIITIDALIEKRIVGESARVRGVKVLNVGKLEKKLQITLPMSAAVSKTVASLA
jgi:large subunit ribosomal protein L15